jgi:DoxX-like family
MEALPMNVVLWILQIALALLYFSGGAYKAFAFEQVAAQLQTLPLDAWRAIGVVEMVGAVLLIVPAAAKWMPALTPIAAAALTLETLAVAALYAQHSLKLTPQNPLLWSVVMGLFVAFVAYGRYALRPLA